MTDSKTSTPSTDSMNSVAPCMRESMSASDRALLAELDITFAAGKEVEKSKADRTTPESTSQPDGMIEGLLKSEQEPEHETSDLQGMASTSEPPVGPKIKTLPGTAVEHPGKGGSAIRLGAMALLLMLAAGMGGLGLWKVVKMEDRLNQMGPVSKVTSAPLIDTASTENTRRIDELERRLGPSLQRMQADLETLGASLAKELERRNARLDGDLAALNMTLSALQEQLQSAQALMAVVEPLGGPAADTATPVDIESGQSLPSRKAPVENADVPAATVSSVVERASRWSVNLFAADRQDKTESELARFRAQDVPAEIISVVNKGKVWYRITVGGFESFDEASAYAETLRTKPGMSGVWVGRN